MAENTSIKELENGRALFAYQCAKEVKDKKHCSESEYKSYVKKIPMLIKTNGLGATLAFIFSKKGTYEVIYNQLAEWLKKSGHIKDYNIKDDNKFLEEVISCDSGRYRFLTMEILAFLNWLRRFAEGLSKNS